MHSFNHILLLLSTFHLASTFTFSEVSSLLSNATQTPLLNLTSPSLLPSQTLQCDPPGTAPPLDEDDCYSALGRVPRISAHAQFHGDSRGDFYNLPLSVWQGKCGITINFVDHVIEEQSSWDEIYEGAYTLLSYCVEGEDGVGGNILVGYNLRIRVTMQYVFDEEAGGRSNNSAILSGRTTSSSPPPPDTSEPNCYLPGTHIAPDPIDCVTVLNRLPTFTSRHAFHKAGNWDGYRLPILAQYQSCEFAVSLVEGVQEEESCWVFIFVAASLLMANCVQDGGGQILLGERNNIRVTLKRSMLETIGNNNSTMLSNRTSPSPLLSVPEPYCYPPGTGNAPEPPDCFAVTNRFPKSTLRGTFHRAGASDGYRLPILGQYQTCEVSITLIEGVQEEESRWAMVYLAASLLTGRCVQGGAHVGGEILVGERDYIRVTVKHSMLETVGNNNSTMLSNRTSLSPPLSTAEPSCYSPGTGYLIDGHDCLTAQYWMPGSPTEGTFHKAGADDGRRLPVRYTHQTCDIFVQLVDDVQKEKSTWVTIGLETWMLVFRCVIQWAHLGGEILIGEGNHIRVTVKNPIQQVKGTITAGEAE